MFDECLVGLFLIEMSAEKWLVHRLAGSSMTRNLRPFKAFKSQSIFYRIKWNFYTRPFPVSTISIANLQTWKIQLSTVSFGTGKVTSNREIKARKLDWIGPPPSKNSSSSSSSRSSAFFTRFPRSLQSWTHAFHVQLHAQLHAGALFFSSCFFLSQQFSFPPNAKTGKWT